MSKEERRIISPEEFAAAMAEASHEGPEDGHIEADALMCETLRRLGYEEGVQIFENFKKWYA